MRIAVKRAAVQFGSPVPSVAEVSTIWPDNTRIGNRGRSGRRGAGIVVRERDLDEVLPG